MGTREKRGQHGDSPSQDTQRQETIPPATTGLRRTVRSDEDETIRSAWGVWNAQTQHTVLVIPPSISYERVSHSHHCAMRARRQPRQKGSLAGAGTDLRRT